MEAEFARANWSVGMCSFGFDSPGSLICSYAQHGSWRLALISLDDKRLETIAIPYREMGQGDLQVDRDRVVLVAGSPDKPVSLLEVGFAENEVRVFRVENDEEVPSGYLSLPEAIEFPTDGGQTAHAFFYPPFNQEYVQEYVAPADEKPPFLITCHGGPHSSAPSELNPTVQYWTSKGLAVLDVNFGGSTGYGREFRERLIGEWGIVDENDCANAALFLVGRGEADRGRIAISRGGVPAASPRWRR